MKPEKQRKTVKVTVMLGEAHARALKGLARARGVPSSVIAREVFDVVGPTLERTREVLLTARNAPERAFEHLASVFRDAEAQVLAEAADFMETLGLRYGKPPSTNRGVAGVLQHKQAKPRG